MKGFWHLLLLMLLGADLLRLSRDDLIEICGLADGIRLNNALQAKWVVILIEIFSFALNFSVYFLHWSISVF